MVDLYTTVFPDSSGEEALAKGVWMLIFTSFFSQIPVVRKPFQKSLGAPNEVDFC